jgi:hypothetical protein
MTTKAGEPGSLSASRMALAAVLLAFALSGCGNSAVGSPTAGPASPPSPSLSPTATPASGRTATPSLSATPASAFSPTGSMAMGRFGHSATLLLDGRVLVAGGQDATGGESDSAELYDPATGQFSQTGPMIYPHISPAAVLLGDGRVLVTGGPLGTVLKRDSSAELYDPSTGKFTVTGFMKVARTGQGTVLLPDGRVLFAGGATTLLAKDKQGFYYPGDDIVLGSAELYDPATGQFTMTGSMGTALEGPTATLLPDGRVLIAGGSVQASSDGWKPTASAELYNPATGRFSRTGYMTTARVGHTATMLPDGRVLIVGGDGPSGPLASAEVYDPATGKFSPTGRMAMVRTDHTATLLPNGRVLIAGGADAVDDSLAANILASAELYDPATGTFSPAGSMATGRQSQTATLLADGRVLIAGGADGLPPPTPLMMTTVALSSAELYQP